MNIKNSKFFTMCRSMNAFVVYGLALFIECIVFPYTLTYAKTEIFVSGFLAIYFVTIPLTILLIMPFLAKRKHGWLSLVVTAGVVLLFPLIFTDMMLTYYSIAYILFSIVVYILTRVFTVIARAIKKHKNNKEEVH